MKGGMRFGSALAAAAAIALTTGCAERASSPDGSRLDLAPTLAAGGRFQPPKPEAERRPQRLPRPVITRDDAVALERGLHYAPVRLGGSGTITVEARFSTAAGVLRVELLDVAGRAHPLAAIEPNAPHVDAPIAPARTGLHILALDADPAGGDAIELLRLTAPSSPPPAPPPASAARPNVVIVVLDAARARNVGAYGYDRDTTPHIDRLAAESLLFTAAFAECPTTACSIPNLITGLPFVDLGDARREWRLPDEIVTLAESLGGIGYRTIALSANVNNSVARNSHQGFDRFDAVWIADSGRGRHPAAHDPHRLSRLALDAVREVPADQPVYLQLHYIPPHEPYAPRPEFDQFGDPDYAGMVGPKFKLRAVRKGQIELTQADIDEAVALYDGNLRMADDAVGALIAGLRELGRWDDTVLLVTSDHGEAFFEHGRHGHNSTLYDEMLHVPFVLRVPGVAPGRRDDLVTLGDVVPTVLGRVGLRPSPGVVGVDLLATPPDPSRALFLRRFPIEVFAVRSRAAKVIFPAGSPPRAYDLAADPDERDDVARARPHLVDAFRVLLGHHRQAAAALQFAAGEPVEFSDDELEALRALGYID